MELFSVFDISAAGLSVEQSKFAVAASNLANARTTRTADGGVYKPLSVSVRSTTQVSYAEIAQGISTSALPRPTIAGVVASEAPPRLLHDPGHPDADERGFVSLPAIDPVTSALDLMTISRSYEANLRAFDITRSLIQRTIELGKSR